MRVLIVEDETAAAENLEYLLHKADADIEVAANTESVEQTVKWLSHNAVDLIFMDIHLSDGSAFSLFDSMHVATPIIFTTAYDQYALDAFKVNSIDYLLKPIKPSDLQRALDKFHRFAQPDINRYLERLNTLATRPKYLTRFLISEKDKIIPLSVDNIACIYCTDRKTDIITCDGQSIRYNRPLDAIMAELDPAKFIRANKQFIISHDAVADITVWFDNRLRIRLSVATPEEIYVAKNRVSEFKQWLTE